MYLDHFGLREHPFGITPDTSFFFAWPTAQEAINTLLVAVRHGEGFIKITGEVGTGKTLLCRKFMTIMDREHRIAYIPNPMLEPQTMMLALADELDIALDRDADQHRIMKALTHRLMDYASEGKQVVLCIDEAQAIPLETLEALRLLTNLETEKRKLLQIVMFGQPELDRHLQDKSIRQLAQRITFHYCLGPLSVDDMEFYLAHRLGVAGYQGSRLFKRSAVSMLRFASGGIPRLVNVLAHKSLMLAYGKGDRQIGMRHVYAAAKDTLAARTLRLPLPWLGAATVLSAGIGLKWMGWS
jgi:MSHA biogenesis protein MshM